VSGPLDQVSGGLTPPDGSPRRRRTGRWQGARSLLIAAASTAALFTLLGVVAVNAPGWDRVSQAFFDVDNFLVSAPGIIGKFGVNVSLFVIAELLILAFGLVLAVMRSLPGPVLFPVRLLRRRRAPWA
jgi:polar amino acid transport system permease protein